MKNISSQHNSTGPDLKQLNYYTYYFMKRTNCRDLNPIVVGPSTIFITNSKALFHDVTMHAKQGCEGK